MIKDITKKEIYQVTTDEEDYNQYTRYSANHWMVTMGESDEPVFDCEELEMEFQEMIKDNSICKRLK